MRTHMSTGLARALLGTALLVAGAIASADDAACAQQETKGLEDLRASTVILQLGPICYGVPEEQQPLTQEIFKLIGKDATPDLVATALRTLATSVHKDALYGEQPPRDAFVLSAVGAAEDVARKVPPGEGRTKRVVWEVDNGTVPAVPGLNIKAILDERCKTIADARTQSCQDAISSAKAWLRVVQLTDAALSRYSAAAINELLTRSTTRLAMWHAYRNEALPQFQWEWFLNSWRLNKADDRPRDANNQPMGPMKVPTDQIIFLHPGVGLEYRNEPDKQAPAGSSTTSRTAPIVYLEVLGRYRWSWDESTGKMIGGNGVSLVATYADRGDDTKVGYGLMFHTRFMKNYTLGITRSGDATNIIFNVDLAEYFKDKLGYWKEVESLAKQ